MKEQTRETLLLAALIGILPPLWAVIGPYLGIRFGPVALISAGIYAANGNRFEDAHRIARGELAGLLWAGIAMLLMQNPLFGKSAQLFLVLCVGGMLAVLIAERIPAIFHLPAWLTGWAIGMLILNENPQGSLTETVIQIAVAMLAGVYYIGALTDKLHRLLR